MAISKRLFWVGTVVAAWQILGCSKISEQTEPSANAIGTVASQSAHRKIYQHSVIPGGVYSGVELDRARRTDPIVGLHYADFGSDVHTARLKEDELVYISYRKANKVYWSKKKHRVCQGEAIVTDAKGNQARSRCGNRLSKTPKLPTGKTEPTEAALNTPEAGPPIGPSISGASPEELAKLPQPDPFAGPGANNGLNPNDRNAAQTGAGAAPPPVSTGAGGSNTDYPPTGFYPTATPYFSGGPLVTPGIVTTTSGAGGGTATTGGGTTTTGGGTTTTTTVTPEPESLLMVLLGCGAIYSLRRRSHL